MPHLDRVPYVPELDRVPYVNPFRDSIGKFERFEMFRNEHSQDVANAWTDRGNFCVVI